MRGGLAAKSDRLSGAVLVSSVLGCVAVIAVALPFAMSSPFPTPHQGDWVIQNAIAPVEVAQAVAPAAPIGETTIIKKTAPTRSLTVAALPRPARPATARPRHAFNHIAFSSRWKRTGIPASDNAGEVPTGTVRLALADEGAGLLAAPKLTHLEVPTEAARIKPAEKKAEAPAPKKPVDLMAAVDDYLWQVYERAPVKKDNTGDFTWKDIAAARRMHVSLKDYVIRGMDPDFREQLFHAGHAMDAAGLHWSMLSAFRDDYRQTLAAGFKARTGNSLHGGSRAVGGYGHGRAIDINNIDGGDEVVWHWIDAHGAHYGLRRPMPGIDPAHIQSGGNWHEIAQAMRAGRTHTALAEAKKPTTEAAARPRHRRRL
jgi:hypothetical protein